MTHTRPDRALSLKAPLMNEDIMLRFDKFVQLVVTISARMLAARFRKVNREVLVREKVSRGSLLPHARQSLTILANTHSRTAERPACH